ncbi:hypothetical protein C9374_012505 [Naegleria lovaniensis]|uniref:Protein kinase domain-containing protein n=1 Tax=Naegleria lovaniensis TaxID=51637 RepID=A0AA88GWD7_NAELO|nr:uncharacterized protein C9374_012505 [Naegleria lovaniensis]KAG2392253.1 hypothetical protein C9374_012505 [Naegleria lovaniensis]
MQVPINTPTLSSFYVPSFDLSKRRTEKGQLNPEKMEHPTNDSSFKANTTNFENNPSVMMMTSFQEASYRRDRYQKIAEIQNFNSSGVGIYLWPSCVKFFQARDFKMGEYKTIIEIDCKKAENPSSFLMYFMSQFNMYSHKNLIPILDTYMTKTSCCFVTPFYPQGNLLRLVKTRLEKQKFLKGQTILKYFSQLLDALSYLHNTLNTTMYGCISLENIFLDETLENVFLGYVGIHIHTMNLYLNAFFKQATSSVLEFANLIPKTKEEEDADDPFNYNNVDDGIKSLFGNTRSTSNSNNTNVSATGNNEMNGWKLLDIYALGVAMFQIMSLTMDMNSEDLSQETEKNALQFSHTYQLIKTLQQQQQFSDEELSYWKEYIRTKVSRIYHNRNLTNLVIDMLNIGQSRLTAEQCSKQLANVHPEDDDDDENTP